MALNISAWSIRRPLPGIVLSVVFMLLGVLSFLKLPITQYPNVDLPIISVVVTQFGAAPSELESQVTKEIEDAVSGIEGVKEIRSSVFDGVSATTITFNLEANPDRALNDVKDAVTRIRANLPSNIEEPLVQLEDVVGLPIVTYAVIARGKNTEELSWFVDDVVRRQLQGLRGVGKVERIGGVERQILVELNPDRLQAVGLTVADVNRRLRGNDIDLAGGRAEIGARDEAIRTLAGSKSLDALRETMVALRAGGEVRLGDLGVVTDAFAEPRTFANLNGEKVVGFSVWRSKGASDLSAAQDVARMLDDIRAAHPEVDLQLIDTSVVYTKGNYDQAVETLLEGAALAVVVVFIFLRNLRATIIAVIALPLSVLPTFWVISALGFSLNLLSLLAITLSTGILVDDAIVEIENIVRHIHMGKSPYQAALEAADEIGLAVIAISIAIVALFIPTSFMTGIAGQFFKQFGITVAVQVLFSLLTARFITPMLAAYFLRAHMPKERRQSLVMQVYTELVSWSVQHRFVTLSMSLVFIGGSILGLLLLPSDFLPKQDTARSLLAVELPSGSQLEETEAKTETIVKRLRARPEVASVFVDGGRIPQGPLEVRAATLTINYVPAKDRSLSQADLEQMINSALADVPDIRHWLIDENGERGVSLVVTGRDGNTVGNVAIELARQMKRIPHVTNVIADTTLDRPELRIIPRKDLAARLGVSTEALSEAVRVATIGDVGPNLAKCDLGGRQVPVRVQLERSGRADQQTLEQIRIPTAEGATIPLLAIADVTLAQGPAGINRYDRQRRATVEADLVGNAALEGVRAQMQASAVMKRLPPGVKVIWAGTMEEYDELIQGFIEAMSTGLVMVYAVLVLLFTSVLQPITILFSAPLSIGGAFIGLLIAGKAITVPVYIGVLMLVGIVTKNAIMLVDFAIEAMHRGADRTTALIEAAQKRVRPIVMTTIAMIAGMSPAAFGVGAGGEFRAPMAIAVIGGLILSTLLSLLFVPAVFALMDDIGRGVFGWASRYLLSSSNATSTHETLERK